MGMVDFFVNFFVDFFDEFVGFFRDFVVGGIDFDVAFLRKFFF